jgi:hypothetical protein
LEKDEIFGSLKRGNPGPQASFFYDQLSLGGSRLDKGKGPNPAAALFQGSRTSRLKPDGGPGAEVNFSFPAPNHKLVSRVKLIPGLGDPNPFPGGRRYLALDQELAGGLIDGRGMRNPLSGLLPQGSGGE